MNADEKTGFSGTISQFVSFLLGDEEYGVDISLVHEIIRFPEITHVPQMPEFIDGVINLRGRVIPVMNLRKKFGFQEVERDNKQRIIVVEIEQKVTGVIVDGVSEVLDIESGRIDEAPAMGTRVNTDFIKGMAKLNDERLMILLNIEKILTSEEIVKLAAATSKEASAGETGVEATA